MRLGGGTRVAQPSLPPAEVIERRIAAKLKAASPADAPFAEALAGKMATEGLVRERFNEERLSLVKYLVIAQELFANRQSLDPGSSEDQARWNLLLHGKWIDPLLGVMTIYDALRRGRRRKRECSSRRRPPT